MITGYSFRKKALATNNAVPERYIVLRRQFTVGIGLLLLCFFGALMVMDFLSNWDSNSSNAVYINSDPRLMKEAMEEIFDVVKLLVIFCFVGIATKMILGYREQVAKLNNSSKSV